MAKRIYVGNLPWSYGASELEELFGQYGEVAAAEVVMDRESGRSRGFGFVQMQNADMGAAIDGLNGQDCDGRALVVNEARERSPRGGGDGGGYAGGGGRGAYGGGRGGYGGGGGGRDGGSRRY